ncbi:MAG: hypothetical protein N2446_02020 [Elusimicrobiales bacterium]|nr:hypothetical protein [Elusimicrobiales bacterium]
MRIEDKIYNFSNNKDIKKIKEASSTFEVLFLKNILKNSGFLKENNIYNDILCDFFSKEIAKNGIGLGDYIFKLIINRNNKD